MRRFIVENIENDHITFSKEESKHIVKVLRLKSNHEIELIDGNGGLAKAKLKDTDVIACNAEIIARTKTQINPNMTHIVMSPTKNHDKIEWVIEKGTELGVREFSFITCENSERHKINLDRLERIMLAATKQCLRLFFPKINPLINFKQFINQHPNGLIAFCSEGHKSYFNHFSQPNDLPILIGPEGDFSKDEINLALMSGYKGISFGNFRLRTETAALYACCISNGLNNNEH